MKTRKSLKCFHCHAMAMRQESIGEVVEENAWVKTRIYIFRCMECGKASQIEHTWWSDNETPIDFNHIIYG